MQEQTIKDLYEVAKEKYSLIGVDVDEALENLKKVKISINCWQGDDIQGFMFPNQ